MTPRLFQLYQIIAGSGDAATGLLLLVAPAFTLRLMGIHPQPADLVFISFIGAFVLGVGLSYLLTAKKPATSEAIAAVHAAWRITGVIRLSVALFVASACLRRQLQPAWLTVAIFDLSLASFQLWAARTGLLRK